MKSTIPITGTYSKHPIILLIPLVWYYRLSINCQIIKFFWYAWSFTPFHHTHGAQLNWWQSRATIWFFTNDSTIVTKCNACYFPFLVSRTRANICPPLDTLKLSLSLSFFVLFGEERWPFLCFGHITLTTRISIPVFVKSPVGELIYCN